MALRELQQVACTSAANSAAATLSAKTHTNYESAERSLELHPQTASNRE